MLDKALKEELRAEFQKVWGKDEKMVNYCVNQASQIVRLSGGQLYVIEKERLDTHFCYGWSSCGQGAEYEEAQKMAADAKHNTENFRYKNTRELQQMIDDLQPTPADYCGVTRPDPFIREHYCRGNANIYNLAWLTDYQVRYEEWRYRDWAGFQKLSDEDRNILIAAYKAELEKKNKQIDAYLKRYGTSKFRTWTYWLDE